MPATATPAHHGSGSLAKRILVGRPVASSHLEHTLLPKWLALPVFSSDALSSVAYASEEILRVLLLASVGAAHLVTPIAIAIAALMVIVVASYRQTVRAYPSGGGAYIVSKDNLGTGYGLVAAAALLVDYMMTVVVSVVAGVLAIISAVPGLASSRVALAVGFVVLITLANLRGVREAGTIFAIPTYAFVACITVLIAIGIGRCASGGCPTSVLPSGIHPEEDLAAAVGAVGVFTMLRAFSSGATALTGVEAISNGVPAFRHPQSRNAAQTLALMGAIAVTMFLGISFLTTHIHGITVSPDRSVLAQIGSAVFGEGSALFYVVQAFTAAILVLAANTAYQDFPRLASILARDRFMPRQFTNRGDRLVFSNGVIGLGLLSIVVIVAFDADLTRLIQLYVVGVFTSFTLSQSGMVRHWWRERLRGPEASRGWRTAIVINAVGAVTTGIVLVVVTSTKFLGGAWLSITVMALIVPTLRAIHRHYTRVHEQLRRGAVEPGRIGANHVVLLVSDLSPATGEALGYIRSLRPADVHAVFLGSPDAGVRRRWDAFAGPGPGPGPGLDLEPLSVRDDDLLAPVRARLQRIDRAPDDFVTVVIPEVIQTGLLRYLLRRGPLVRLKAGLLREPNVVVSDVPVPDVPVPDVPVPDVGGVPIGADARALIPQRTVTLVFVSAVHDATVRAVNFARSLDATETRAIHFDLDPDTSRQIEEEWFDRRLGIPLDVVEAPFRDLTGPMLEEVRRYTARRDTLVTVVLPEFVVTRLYHLILHNQSALFVKRLFLFEERVVLSSVPFLLSEDPPRSRTDAAGAKDPDGRSR